MGNRIKHFRKEGKKYTSAESFALDHGIDKSTYWEWEKGYNITWESVKRIMRIHALTTKEFFSEGFDLK